MNIEKFVENLNRLSKVKVYGMSILKNSISTKKEEIKNKKDEILDELEEMGSNFTIYNEKEVIKALNLPNINRETLKEKIINTGKQIYILIDELKTLNTALQGFENFERNIDKEGYIHPKFSVNVKGLVSVAEPGLSRLENDFIRSVLGFYRCTEFNSFDSLYNFIKKFRPMMGVRKNNQNSFIVVGMTLYYDFRSVELWDITEAYKSKVKELYNQDAPCTLNARSKFVTGKTYGLFNEVYNELLPILENTKVAKECGVLKKEIWFGSLPKGYFKDETYAMPFGGANSNEELEIEHQEGLKERIDEFNSLYNQYSELKVQVEKGEDITGITKEKEIINMIRKGFRTRAMSRLYGKGIVRSEEGIETEIDTIMKNLDIEAEVKEEIKVEPKQEEVKPEIKPDTKVTEIVEPTNMKIFDMDKNREIMRGYGWAEDIIEKNIAEIQAVEDKINSNFNSPTFEICGVQNSDEVYDFICAGRGKIIATRMVIDRKVDSDDISYNIWFSLNKVRQTLTVTAPKGSAHRTLMVTLPDGTIQTYTASNKKNNIRQITTAILNTLA